MESYNEVVVGPCRMITPHLANCFSASLHRNQVNKLLPGNDIEEVEEIYDCIRVAHPRFSQASLPEFIDFRDEVMENSGEEESNVF